MKKFYASMLIFLMAFLVIMIVPIEAANGSGKQATKSSPATTAVMQKINAIKPLISQRLAQLRQSLKTRLAGAKIIRGTIRTR